MSSEHESSEAGSKKAGLGSARKILRAALLLILAVLVVLLVVDRLSLANYKEAVERMKALLPEIAQGPDPEPLRDEVRTAMGREPIGEMTDDGDYLLEIYRWRRGMPWQTLEIKVHYSNDDPPILQEWVAGQEGWEPPARNQPARSD